jgi:hypothetical protein
MHQVNLSEQLYQDAQRRAAEAGFKSVDEYVEDVLVHELSGDAPNLDHFFTPERMAAVERSLADADQGNVSSAAEVMGDLAKYEDEWQRQHPDAK